MVPWNKGIRSTASRNREILEDRRRGYTLSAIAKKFEISTQRVSQICYSEAVRKAERSFIPIPGLKTGFD